MITDYASLQTTAAQFMQRDDLTSIMPQLVRLAEDVIYGDLDARQQDVKSTLTTAADTQTLALPNDFMSFRSVSVAFNSSNETLTYLSPTQFYQEYQYDNKGVPRAYTIIGSNILMQPIPDAAYTLNIVYEAKLTNLSDSNTTNWLITAYPSVYLYATLMQCALYIRDDESGAKWANLYQKVVQGVNLNDYNNGNTLQVKTDINLTSLRT